MWLTSQHRLCNSCKPSMSMQVTFLYKPNLYSTTTHIWMKGKEEGRYYSDTRDHSKHTILFQIVEVNKYMYQSSQIVDIS